MCGRYVVVSELKAIEKKFNVQTENPEQFQPNYNIGPGSYAPIVASDAPHTLRMSQFGLTPFWAKKRMYLFNARSEGDQNKSDDPMYNGARGIITKPAFRKPIRSQRCLIVADAFYEGPKTERLSKPYLVYRRNGDRPFAFAGLFDHWTDPETGEIICSHSIITTVSNKLTQRIGHHRSPVILHEQAYSTWIDPDTPLEQITALLEPFPAAELNAYPVSPRVKDPRENDAELLQPTGERIEKEYDYEIARNVKLFGMGQSPARDRRMKGS
ncbi:MAG: SOS response-associated peptidase [Flavobacteriales bacterium]|nr:SOS response-associated peptidase [Flavobacteriales bacterium]